VGGEIAMRLHIPLNRSLIASIVIAELLLVVVAGLASAQGHGSIDLYRSDQFDYYFFYDASRWQIVDQSSESESDFVRLSDGETTVDYWAFAATDTSPVDCLNDVLDEWETAPSIVEIEALFNQGGSPMVQGSDSLAVASLVVTVDGDDGRSKLAAFMRCEELDPGKTLLYTESDVPAALWNETQRYDRPWEAGYMPVDENRPTAPVPIPTGNGQVQGSLKAELVCKLGGPFFVVAENTAPEGTFHVDDTSFKGVYNTGEVVPATFNGWLYPQVTPNSGLALRPGEVGLFELEIGAPSDPKAANLLEVYYAPTSGAPVYLGSAGGCGAGAGAPVLIDLE
jgi:hypothetical protein